MEFDRIKLALPVSLIEAVKEHRKGREPISFTFERIINSGLVSGADNNEEGKQTA